MAKYRCSVCNTVSVHADDEEFAVCNVSDACGLLFDDEIVVEKKTDEKAAAKRAARSLARSLRFELIGDGYVAGDERPYEVIRHGRHLGVVERAWLVAATPGGEPPLGWSFRSADSKRVGEGVTRAAAVLAAQ